MFLLGDPPEFFAKITPCDFLIEIVSDYSKPRCQTNSSLKEQPDIDMAAVTSANADSFLHLQH